MALKTSLLLLFVFTNFAHAEALTLDSAQSNAEFLAIGKPSMIKIHGKDAQVSGSLEQKGALVNGSFQVDLDQFHTGIETRDKHMKEKYLETSKPGYKSALLSLLSLALPANFFKKGGEQKAIPFGGKLSLHGVQKEIQGLADVSAKEGACSGSASFKIKLNDFGVLIPTFAGITVADDVEVTVHFQGKVN